MTGSGIGIVRISGEEAFAVADRMFRAKSGKKLSDVPSHTVHYGFVEDGGEVIDEVLVTVLRAPHSFTAEDTAEINCHGGVYAMKRILELAVRRGARPAEPGEFTKRAFLNGRIDLSQAEAVIDVIQSQNEYALKSSVSQLRGSVQRAIRGLREKILYETAFIESALDDPEHISLDGYPERLKNVTENIISDLEKLIASSENGKRLREGIRTAIIGKPNAGKSSLLNVLLGEERAIVTDIAGTTRDTLEEQIQIHGISLQVIDTAGIRDTRDAVEQIGVERARACARDADLVLFVVDAATDFDQNDEEILEIIREKNVIVLLNKTDLETVVSEQDMKEKINQPVISISAKEETGIERLETAIKDMFYEGELSFNDQIYITNTRQRAALEAALESMKRVLASIGDGLPEDFFSIDLMDAYGELGTIIGESVGEDLVNEIFGRFCMGK